MKGQTDSRRAHRPTLNYLGSRRAPQNYWGPHRPTESHQFTNIPADSQRVPQTDWDPSMFTEDPHRRSSLTEEGPLTDWRPQRLTKRCLAIDKPAIQLCYSFRLSEASNSDIRAFQTQRGPQRPTSRDIRIDGEPQRATAGPAGSLRAP